MADFIRNISEELTVDESVVKSPEGIDVDLILGEFHQGTINPPEQFTRTYIPWPLGRDSVSISLTEHQDSLRITLSNIKWDRHLGKLRTEDLHGKVVRIWQGFLDIAQTEANLGALFEGEIDRVSFNESAIVIDLKGNIKYLDREGLSRTFSIYCPFKFKERQCGYTGPDETCDKSFADCTSKGNTRSFGGFNTLLRIQGTRTII